METQKQQIVDRIKQANNILVTVKSNPTVDHLSACIALTLALNKMGKHATAVFSGEIPSTIEFLQPEKTLEKNTDSLRDFIIALDKSKADKLRYKVEDKVVKIFITPYRTSISEQDLNFSQGDFNVDVVLALGVHLQTDLDQAITAHGRILHDATVAGINVAEGPNLGSLSWTKTDSSSLSELVVELIDAVDKKLLDGQIATAALTGIVAETDRFSNNRTSPQTMSISSELMTAGANQQLVATKLAEPVAPPVVANVPAEAKPEASKKQSEDGTLEIEHEGAKPDAPQIHIDDEGSLKLLDAQPVAPATATPPVPESPKVSEAEAAGLPAPMELPDITPEHTEGPHMILQPPTLGGQLSAESTSSAEFFDPMMDSASGAPAGGQPHQAPMILNREPLGGSAKAEEEQEKPPTPEPEAAPMPEPPITPPIAAIPEPVTTPAPSPAPASLPPIETPQATPGVLNTETLSDIEKQLNSPHVTEANAAAAGDVSLPDVSSARDAVEQAIHSSGDVEQALAPIQALNAQPVNLALHDATPSADAAAPAPTMPTETVLPATPSPAPYAPQGLSLPGVEGATSTPTAVPQFALNNTPTEPKDPNAPPPVPPPMLPPIPGQ